MTEHETGRDRRDIFRAVMITSFIGPFMASSVNVAIPAMAADFGVPANSLSWVVTAFLMGAASLLIPCGRLADIRGRKRLYQKGALAVSVAACLSGSAPSVPLLLVCRFFQGLALSTIFSTSIALMVAAHDPNEKGRAIGWSAASTYVGLSVGPTLGGLVTQYASWRVLFYVTGAVCLLSWRYAKRVSGEWYGEKGEMDYAGAALYFASMVLSLGGLSGLSAHPSMKYCLVAGAAAFAAFCVRQYRAGHPLIRLSMFRSRAFSFSSLAALLNYSSTYAIVFLLSLYLQLVRGFSTSRAGVFILIQPFIMAVLSPKAGALSDRVRPQYIATAGMALTTIGVSAFSFLTEDTPMAQVAATFVVVGVGFALFSSPNNNAIMSAAPPEHYGIAASVVSAMRLIGQSLSMAVVTFMLAGYGDAEIVEPLQRTFTMLAATGVVASFFSLARGKGE